MHAGILYIASPAGSPQSNPKVCYPRSYMPYLIETELWFRFLRSADLPSPLTDHTRCLIEARSI